jgi:hypothetical protein
MSEHPITPPPKLLKQWEDDWFDKRENVDVLLIQAFQAGADQELEACCAIALTDPVCGTKHQRSMLVHHMRKQRRPKPPSLKEQALEALRHAPGPDYPNPITLLTADEHALIRRALEQLDD